MDGGFTYEGWLKGLRLKGGLEVTACSSECSKAPKHSFIKGLAYQKFRQMLETKHFPDAKKMEMCPVCNFL